MSKVKVTIDGVEKEIDIDDAEEFEKEGIHVVHNTVRKRRKHDFRPRLIGATPLIAIVTYLAIGFIGRIWHPTWLVFLLIPIVPIVLYGFDKGRKAVMTVISIFATITFFILGYFGYWHPGWLVFFIIPIMGILIGTSDD